MAIHRGDIYNNLAHMTEAGVSPLKSLRTVTEGSFRYKKSFNALADAVERGDSIAEGMKQDKRHFPDLEIIMIDIGERSGHLSEVMQSLSRWYDFKRRIFQIFFSEFAYPIFLLHALFFIIPIPPFILGNITMTQYLLSVFYPLAKLYSVILAIFLFYRLCTGRNKARVVLDTLLLKIPLLGLALRDLALARYSGMFRALYEAGASMHDCATMSADSCGNTAMAAKFDGGSESVRQHGTVYEGFPKSLPKQFLTIWNVGEESGSLSDSLERLSNYYMDSGEFMLKELSRWVPRLIYLGVVIYMAFLVLQGWCNYIGGMSAG